jgi:hypothetical protein
VSGTGSILRAMIVLRADPWAPEYGMGFEARVDEPAGPADPSVETADWSRTIAPTARPLPSVSFVDGVRRVELRLVADQDDVRAPGLFGSFAVGSVRCDGRAAFDEHRVGRAVVVGGGLAAADQEVTAGGARLCYRGFSEASSDPDAPLERLQDLMRAEENALAARLAGSRSGLVIVDGPLRLGEPIDGPIVGAIKRFVRRYLEPEQDRLLGRLRAGERTPVFALLDEGRATRGYSWYARVADLTGPWHDRAGVVRCEVRASLGLDASVVLADRVTSLLPSFAGRAADPRTPQNLAPIAGLESWLRHRMGDARMIRRSLLTHLARRP